MDSLQGLQNLQSLQNLNVDQQSQLANPHSTPKQLAHLENARPSAHKARRMSAKALREEAIRVASLNMVTEFLKVKGLRSDCFEDVAMPSAIAAAPAPQPVAIAQPQPVAIAAIASAQPAAQPQPKKKRAKKHVKPLTPPTTEDESTTQVETTETEISEIECPQPRKRKHRSLVFEEPRYEQHQRYIEPNRFYSSSSQFCS